MLCSLLICLIRISFPVFLFPSYCTMISGPHFSSGHFGREARRPPFSRLHFRIPKIFQSFRAGGLAAPFFPAPFSNPETLSEVFWAGGPAASLPSQISEDHLLLLLLKQEPAARNSASAAVRNSIVHIMTGVSSPVLTLSIFCVPSVSVLFPSLSSVLLSPPFPFGSSDPFGDFLALMIFTLPSSELLLITTLPPSIVTS